MTALSPASPPEETLDARGLICPLPVLRAQRKLRGMETGSVLTVLTTDPASATDFPDFCAEAGYELQRQERRGDEFRFVIRKNG